MSSHVHSHSYILFLCCGCRKWVRMVFRFLETWRHRLRGSRFLRRPEGKLTILRGIRLHKYSLKRLRPSCFFQCSGCKKYVRMLFRQLETSLHPIQQSRILRRPQGRLCVFRAIAFLKHYLTYFVQVALVISNMQKIISHGLLTPWNIASSTSPVVFQYFRRQISSQGHSPT
jgi:hypothetical protein